MTTVTMIMTVALRTGDTVSSGTGCCPPVAEKGGNSVFSPAGPGPGSASSSSSSGGGGTAPARPAAMGWTPGGSRGGPGPAAAEELREELPRPLGVGGSCVPPLRYCILSLVVREGVAPHRGYRCGVDAALLPHRRCRRGGRGCSHPYPESRARWVGCAHQLRATLLDVLTSLLSAGRGR